MQQRNQENYLKLRKNRFLLVRCFTARSLFSLVRTDREPGTGHRSQNVVRACLIKSCRLFVCFSLTRSLFLHASVDAIRCAAL